MVISYTIDNHKNEDWDNLLNIISKYVLWNDKISNTLTQCIYDIMAKKSVENDIYGIYDIQINNITYINLIIKSKDTNIMICDYPKQTINKTSLSNYWKYMGIGMLTITILGGLIYGYKYK